VRPILEYGSAVWYPIIPYTEGGLRCVQRTFYGFILNIPHSFHGNGPVAQRLMIDDWLNAKKILNHLFTQNIKELDRRVRITYY